MKNKDNKVLSEKYFIYFIYTNNILYIFYLSSKYVYINQPAFRKQSERLSNDIYLNFIYFFILFFIIII